MFLGSPRNSAVSSPADHEVPLELGEGRGPGKRARREQSFSKNKRLAVYDVHVLGHSFGGK